MAEINARALMFNLGREDAIDSTTSAKIARYAERKQLAYKLTDEGVLLLDGRGKKIHLRNGVVTLRNALGLHALPERIGDNRVLNKQQQHTNVVTMLHVRKMALVDPRLLKSLRENPTPLPDAIDTALRDLDAEMTSILDGSDADESEKVRLYNQALLRYNDMTKARAAKPIPVVVEVKKEAAATTASVVEPAHYYDPKRVGSYGGVAALRRVVPAERDVERWLSTQDAYTLHKPVRRHFKRRCVVVGGPNQQWQADLVDMSRLKTANDGTTFLLTVIDVFSKRAWCIPLKSKSAASLVAAFRRLLNDVNNNRPTTLQTDKGSEF